MDDEIDLRKAARKRGLMVGCSLVLSAVMVIALYAYLYVVRPAALVARTVEAHAVLRGCHLSLTKICIDAGVTDLRAILQRPEVESSSTFEETIERHTLIVYDILRNGKASSVELRPESRIRMGSVYMELERDPWGHRYQFFIGPWPEGGFPDQPTNPFKLSPDVIDSKLQYYAVSMGPDGKLNISDSTQSVLGDDIVSPVGGDFE